MDRATTELLPSATAHPEPHSRRSQPTPGSDEDPNGNLVAEEHTRDATAPRRRLTGGGCRKRESDLGGRTAETTRAQPERVSSLKTSRGSELGGHDQSPTTHATNASNASNAEEKEGRAKRYSEK